VAHLQHKLGRVSTPRPRLGGSATASAAAVAIAIAVLLAACSSKVADQVGSPSPSPPTQDATQTALVERVFASVLIAEADEPGAGSSIERVVVSPAELVVDREEVVRLSARAFGEDGLPATSTELVFAMTDLRAGSIRADGVFTAGRTPGTYPGAITVTMVRNAGADIHHATARVPVTVVGEQEIARLSRIELIPESPTVIEGQLYRLRAVGYDEVGLVIPGASFEWSVNDPALGVVNRIGYLAVHGGPGTFPASVSVTAKWNGSEVAMAFDVTVFDARVSEELYTVQVLPQRFFIDDGEEMQLRAYALNGLGELAAGTTLRWSMTNAGAGTVTGTGLFVAGDSPGIFAEAVRVEAIIPGERGAIRAVDYASVVVRGEQEARTLSAVIPRPRSVTVGRGGRAILFARPVDSAGRTADGVKVTWEIVGDGPGIVDRFGSFKASAAPGAYMSSVKVTASQDLGEERISRTATVNIFITGSLSEARIEPALGTVSRGQTVHFTAIGRDENGLTLPGLVVRWKVADPSVGSIDAIGNFTAGNSIGYHKNAIVATVIQPLTN